MTILPRRHLAFVVLSALFLTAAAIGAYVYTSYTAPCSCMDRGPEVSVMTARIDLEPGDALTPAKIVWTSVPQRFLPPNSIGKADARLAHGTTVASAIEKGAMILTSDVTAPAAPAPKTHEAPRDLSDDLAIPTPAEVMPETEF